MYKLVKLVDGIGISIDEKVDLTKLVSFEIWDTAHLAECIPHPADVTPVLATMTEEKHWLPNRLVPLNLA